TGIPTRFSRALDIRRVELHEIDRRLIVLVRRLPIVNGRFWPITAIRDGQQPAINRSQKTQCRRLAFD
ncbi:hypothetical protein, partial [Pseudomonas viridiflava]